MRIRGNKRLLGLMMAPFALFTACVGLTPEEQAEYKELQEEVRRIQVEEIAPRQAELKKIIEGKLVVDIEELNRQVNQIRNEKLGPLEHHLEGLKSGETVLAAPGTKIELEELNRRLEELGLLQGGLEDQIDEYRGQLEAAKKAAGQQVEDQITELEVRRDELIAQIEESGDGDESDGLRDELEAVKGEIEVLREEIEKRHAALAAQFADLIHGLEISLHDILEERDETRRRVHELELSTPEELEQTILELEALINKIVTQELRPLIERMNEATAGGDPNSAARGQIRAELEHWLTQLAELRARMSELSSKSFQSLLNGLDLSQLAGLGS